MGQHLLRLLQVLDFKLLLQKLILFLLKIRCGILFVLVKVLYLFFEIFALLVVLLSYVLYSVRLLFELHNLSADLVLVVFLSLDLVFELKNFVRQLVHHFLVHRSELLNFLKLVLLLRGQLLLVFHFQVIGHLLAVLVHTLHVLQAFLEVIEKPLDISVVAVIKALDLGLKLHFLFVLGLFQQLGLFDLVLVFLVVKVLQLLLALVVVDFQFVHLLLIVVFLLSLFHLELLIGSVQVIELLGCLFLHGVVALDKAEIFLS